jgi:hypothetical protein
VDWSDGSRLAGLQCVHKRFIHCELIWQYVTGLTKSAATKQLWSLLLITSSMVSKACFTPECVGVRMVTTVSFFLYDTIHFFAPKKVFDIEVSKFCLTCTFLELGQSM